MAKYRTNPIVVDAVQITDATFDDPHPNPEHMKGVLYDPTRRTAEIIAGGVDLEIGDWLVAHPDFQLYAFTAEHFAALYEKVDE